MFDHQFCCQQCISFGLMCFKCEPSRKSSLIHKLSLLQSALPLVSTTVHAQAISCLPMFAPGYELACLFSLHSSTNFQLAAFVSLNIVTLHILVLYLCQLPCCSDLPIFFFSFCIFSSRLLQKHSCSPMSIIFPNFAIPNTEEAKFSLSHLTWE